MRRSGRLPAAADHPLATRSWLPRVSMTPKPVLRRPGSMPRMRVATLLEAAGALTAGQPHAEHRDTHPDQGQAGERLAEHRPGDQRGGGRREVNRLATFTALPLISRLSRLMAPTDSTSTSHSSANEVAAPGNRHRLGLAGRGWWRCRRHELDHRAGAQVEGRAEALLVRVPAVMPTRPAAPGEHRGAAAVRRCAGPPCSTPPAPPGEAQHQPAPLARPHLLAQQQAGAQGGEQGCSPTTSAAMPAGSPWLIATNTRPDTPHAPAAR